MTINLLKTIFLPTVLDSKNVWNYREADDNTLLLIDEFGTGSDPELGGALAESFLEFFYEKNLCDYYHALHQH